MMVAFKLITNMLYNLQLGLAIITWVQMIQTIDVHASFSLRELSKWKLYPPFKKPDFFISIRITSKKESLDSIKYHRARVPVYVILDGLIKTSVPSPYITLETLIQRSLVKSFFLI